jgi:dTMP kinase
MSKGKLISFEGGEGAGKTTQIVFLEKLLREKGIETVCVREPGGTPLSEKIRYLLKDFEEDPPCGKAETMLFLAARAQLVEKTIIPALERGAWVLTDRFCDSTIAYQGYGRNLPLETLFKMNDFVCSSIEPDMTFWLDLSVEQSMERMRKRERQLSMTADRIERAGIDFHHRIRTGFMELSKKFPERFVRIDASAKIEEVWSQICSFVKPMI